MRHGVAGRFLCAFTFTCVVVLALARDASADEAPLALRYEAPDACPDETSFIGDVRARIAEQPTVAADGRRLRVRIVEEEGAYRGSLESLDPPSVREVAGETCAEVVRALVVFVALAMSPADPGTSPDPAPPAPVIDGPSVRPPVPAPKEAPAGRWPTRARVGLDARAIAGAGITPGLAPGGAIAARLAVETGPAFRWLVHAGAVVAYRERAVLDGSFVFGWYAARVDAGPALDLGPLRLSAGPTVRAGALSVSARDLPAAGGYTSFWGDVGGFVRADHALAPTVALSLMAELAAPLQRQSFGIAGIEDPVHEIPPVIGIVSFGVALGR